MDLRGNIPKYQRRENFWTNFVSNVRSWLSEHDLRIKIRLFLTVSTYKCIPNSKIGSISVLCRRTPRRRLRCPFDCEILQRKLNLTYLECISWGLFKSLCYWRGMSHYDRVLLGFISVICFRYMLACGLKDGWKPLLILVPPRQTAITCLYIAILKRNCIFSYSVQLISLHRKQVLCELIYGEGSFHQFAHPEFLWRHQILLVSAVSPGKDSYSTMPSFRFFLR